MSVLLYSSDVALVCDIDFNPTTQYLLLLTNSKLRLTFIGFWWTTVPGVWIRVYDF